MPPSTNERGTRKMQPRTNKRICWRIRNVWIGCAWNKGGEWRGMFRIHNVCLNSHLATFLFPSTGPADMFQPFRSKRALVQQPQQADFFQSKGAIFMAEAYKRGYRGRNSRTRVRGMRSGWTRSVWLVLISADGRHARSSWLRHT